MARFVALALAVAVGAGACSSSDTESTPTGGSSEDSAADSGAQQSPEGNGSQESVSVTGEEQSPSLVSPVEAAASGECSSPERSVEDPVGSESGGGVNAGGEAAVPANEVVDLVEQGVVAITAMGRGEGDGSGLASETGSGAVVDDRGLIVTNRHVVEGAELILVEGADSKIRDAEIVAALGGDADLALLLVADAEGLVPIELGASDAVAVGDRVLAIGSPVGVGLSVSAGVLAGRGRNIEVEDAALFNLLQTDAAINPGNSGGPLLDEQGLLVGINTAVVDAEGVGFAIPIEQVIRFVDAFKSGKPVPTLGAQFTTMTPEKLVLTQAPVLGGAGVVVVAEEGPAGEAGIQEGDVVTVANDAPVLGVVELNAAVADAGVDGALRLVVCRQAEADMWSELTIDVTVGGREVVTDS